MSERINAWRCRDCGQLTVGREIDEGCTPFMIDCEATPGCGGVAESSFYRVDPNWPAPIIEWFKPSDKWVRRKSRDNPGLAEHVELGGLISRRTTA